ncbi:hypothetical protein, variant 1 [Exophiala mesophila]|uniref:Xylanolytic transcriptional activator regulatory domain-containing protein n=1 Tax=Exophiala mesophila TaxID=212818 RepID=A0A0D1XRV9_EXOME|nr:hypothetical protein, variant 1 [Exophiala mesophila]KIV90851.1 hypothetical protein, variant 1 [Exophiala mesophila]
MPRPSTMPARLWTVRFRSWELRTRWYINRKPRSPSHQPRQASSMMFDTVVMPSTHPCVDGHIPLNSMAPPGQLPTTTLPITQMPNQSFSNTRHELVPNSPSSQRVHHAQGQPGEAGSNDQTQTQSWEMSNDKYNVDFTDLSINDLIFLEDSLLPDFACESVELIPPFFPTPGVMANAERSSPGPARLLLSCTRQVTPSPEKASTPGDLQREKVATRVLQFSQEDINIFRSRTLALDRQQLSSDFKFPTRVRTIRTISAYFEYFDPHTPIVHRATFDIRGSHPALCLAMLAVGGLHVSEHDFANMAYNACCDILHSIERQEEEGVQRTPDIGVIQALLLCAHFGVYSDNPAYFRRAEKQIPTANSLLREYLDRLGSRDNQPASEWESWIASETCSRLAGWLPILSGVVLSYQPAAALLVYLDSDIPLPRSEELWKTRSSAEWMTLTAMTPEKEVLTILEMTKIISAGGSFQKKLSTFGLLVVIGSILNHICLRERLLAGHQAEPDPSFIVKMEETLASWELLWRQHPQALRVPSKNGSVLLLDCLSPLGSAYYHLYMPIELRALKTFARSRGRLAPLPHPQSHKLTLKAVLYAAHSWFVRAKLGIAHLQKTAALEFGAHTLVAAYEGALILSWWLRNHKQIDSATLSSMPAGHGEARLQHLVNEVTEELQDQNIGCGPETDPCLVPLVCYRTLILPWVWNYATIMRSHLDNVHEQFSEPLVS